MMDTLTDFQFRCIDADRDRIILQPRRSGSTVMQAHLANWRSARGQTVLAMAPNLEMLESGFVDQCLAHGNGVVSAISPPEGSHSIFGLPAPMSERRPGQIEVDPDFLIVDQPQHMSAEALEGLKENMLSEDTEVVLAATGGAARSNKDRTALDYATSSGGFEIMWATLMEQASELPIDRDDVRRTLDTQL